MPHRIADASGNWTAAATWKVADATSLLDSQAGNTALTTTFVASSTFTPGAITVEGIAVKVATRAVTPAAANVEVRLFNSTAAAAVAGTTVAIAVSDIYNGQGFTAGASPVGCPYGWYYFKFAAPVTLLAATLYAVQARITAGVNQVSLFRNATANNWSRLLITSTTGAPAAGDSMFVIKAWTAAATATAFTVTVNETASTDYGSASITEASLGVGPGCALEFPTTGSNLLRLSGLLQLWGDGRLSLGTPSTPIPQGASAFIEFDVTGAGGDFGLTAYPSSSVELNGSPRTAGKDVVLALLNADAAAAATTLNVDTDTGWLNGDEVWVGSTTRTATQTESRTLNADAGASSMTISAGLGNAHAGTAPSQGEVALITRNVGFRATGALGWHWNDGQDTASTWRWASIDRCGGVGGTNRRWDVGIRVSGVGEPVKSRVWEYSYIRVMRSYQQGNVEGSSITFTDCIFYTDQQVNSPGGQVYSSRTNVTVTRGAMFFTGVIAQNGIVMVGATTLTVRDTRFVGCGINAPTTTYGFGQFFTLDIEGANFHSCIANQAGIDGGVPDRYGAFRISECSFWRCADIAVNFNSALRCDLLLERCTFRGNTTFHVRLPAGGAGEPWVRFVDCDFDSETGFATSSGVAFGTQWAGRAEFQECRFSQTAPVMTNDITRTGTVGDMALIGVILVNNCLLSGTTPVAAAVTNQPGGYGRFSYMNEQQIADAHRTLTQFGTIENQSAVFNTAAPCEQLTPTAAALVGVRGLRSSPVFKPVPAGQSVTFSVWIKRQATHNGVAPQIIVWANGQGGWLDTRATYSGGLDVWTELTVTVGPAVSDSVAEAVIEVDGTVGSVYIDDWSATVA